MYFGWRAHACTCVCVGVCAKLLQSCLTLCSPMDCSPPGYSVHGILQARSLEWVAMPSSKDLPNPGIQPVSLISPVLEGRFFTTSTTWKDPFSQHTQIKNVCIPFNCILFTLNRRSWVVCDMPLHRLCWLRGIFACYATGFQLKAHHCFALKPFIASIAQAVLQNLQLDEAGLLLGRRMYIFF